MNSSKIKIHDLSLWVALGIREVELKDRQEVRLSIDLTLPTRPLACETDRIEDTVCYHNLIRQITELVEGRRYNMIEKLAQDVLKVSKTQTPSGTLVKIKVHKVRPPIEKLLGGVSFEIYE